MEQVTEKRLSLFAGRNSYELAEAVASQLDVQVGEANIAEFANGEICLLYTSPSPRDRQKSRMPSSA